MPTMANTCNRCHAPAPPRCRFCEPCRLEVRAEAKRVANGRYSQAKRKEAVAETPDTLKKWMTCLGCGKRLWTDRCHRICKKCTGSAERHGRAGDTSGIPVPHGARCKLGVSEQQRGEL